MKKIFRNNRLIAIAFLTMFSSGAVMAATSDSINNRNPVELKFVGSFNNQTIFQLKVTGNPQFDDFSLIIRDIYGNSIYRENIKAENFSKKFLFDTDELGDETLQLEVYNRKTRQSVIYEINRQYKALQEIVINQIK